jgi:peptidoglycan hydrolase-like protein with peptidoglycan-binding domain
MSTLSVKEIKQKLTKAGFYAGPVDDEVTKEFVAAVSAAQKQLGTFADGMYGQATDAKLDRYLTEQKQDT